MLKAAFSPSSASRSSLFESSQHPGDGSGAHVDAGTAGELLPAPQRPAPRAWRRGGRRRSPPEEVPTSDRSEQTTGTRQCLRVVDTFEKGRAEFPTPNPGCLAVLSTTPRWCGPTAPVAAALPHVPRLDSCSRQRTMVPRRTEPNPEPARVAPTPSWQAILLRHHGPRKARLSRALVDPTNEAG
jgi:hypothetical protein